MQILSINNINHSSSTNFKSIRHQAPKTGILKCETSHMIQDFLHRYNEVKNILTQKTNIGLEKIAQHYPDVTLGENLIFHNCGENKNSISIRVADSEQNRGLVYIARKQGNTESTKKVVLNSFMLDGCSRLISNFKPNHSKYFPKEREYISQETINEQNLEENLQNIFTDLDPALLSFRKFLAKNANTYLKLPDGKLDYTIALNLKEPFKIYSQIEEQAEKINHKRYLAINSNFNDYKLISGLKSYMFQNLGEEKLAINFSEFKDKQGYNLKRLYVYDKNNELIKLFSIIDNEKFVTNINQKNPSVLPEKYTYANTKELETEYLPEFQKYFELYTDKLKEYQKYFNNAVDSLLKQGIGGEFDLNTSSLLSEALDWYKIAKIKLRKLPTPVANSIRASVQKLEPAVGKTGLWLKNEEDKKIIQFLPLNNKTHQNLIRITINDLEGEEKKDFLIHDFKYIVKNYNPQYPTIIPKILKYASEKEIEDHNLTKSFRYLKNKCEELATKADKAYETREEIFKQKKAIKEEQKIKNNFNNELNELKKSCKQQFEDALKNLDKGIEQFNQTIKELQNKVTEFYNTQKQNKNN